MRRILQFIRLAAILLILFSTSTSATAQSIWTGSVIDNVTGAPLPGAAVQVSGADGTNVLIYQIGSSFSLPLPGGTYEAIVDALGYQRKTIEVIVQDERALDVRLDRSFNSFGRVEGRITDQEGAPVTDAEIALLASQPVNGDTLISIRREYTARTDASGRYAVEEMIPEEYFLTVSAAGYVQGSTAILVGDGAGATADLVLQSTSASPTAFLTGVVRDAETGEPLPGTVVRLLPDQSQNPPTGEDSLKTLPYALETVTDAQGAYLLEEIEPNTPYALQFSAPGYEPHVEHNLVFEPGETIRRDIDAVPLDLSDISGRVIYDGTDDGVSNALLLFMSSSAGSHAVRTDASGEYSIDVPAADDYIVLVRTVGTDSAFVYTEYYDDAASIAEAARLAVADDVVTGPSGVLSAVNFSIPDLRQTVTTTIEGRVLNEDGDPVNGATVWVSNYFGFRDLQRFSATTAADGSYSVSFTGPFLQYLVAWAARDGYEKTYYDGASAAHLADPIEVAVDNTVVESVDITLRSSAAAGEGVSGLVTDAAGAPLADVLVAARPAQGGLVRHAYTASDGSYRLDLGSQAHYIHFFSDGFQPLYAGGTRTWDVSRLASHGEIVDVQLQRLAAAGNGDIVGVVLDERGDPADGATVWATNEDGQVVAAAIALADGSYRLEGVGSGMISVRGDRVGSKEALVTLQAGPNQTSIADIRLEAAQHVGADGHAEVPASIVLEAAYPNPFNPTTTISFSVDRNTHVQLEVHDLLGRHVATLVDRTVQAGRHTTLLDAGTLSSGLYVYQMRAEGQRLSRTVLLMK